MSMATMQEVLDLVKEGKLVHIQAEICDNLPWWMVLERRNAKEGDEINPDPLITRIADFYVCWPDQYAFIINHVNTDSITIV